jgi:hypothetical protein
MNPLQLRNKAKTNVQSNAAQKPISPSSLVGGGFFKPGADAIENITKQAGNDNIPVNKISPNGSDRNTTSIPALKNRPGETAAPEKPTQTTTPGPFGVKTNSTNENPAAVSEETATTISKNTANALGGQAQVKPKEVGPAANDNQVLERRFRDEPLGTGEQSDPVTTGNPATQIGKNQDSKNRKQEVKFPMLMFTIAGMGDIFIFVLGLFGIVCTVFGLLPGLGMVFLLMGILTTGMIAILRTVFSFIIFGWSKVYQLENYAKSSRSGKLKKMMTAGPAAVVKQVIFWIGMIPYLGFFIPSSTTKVYLTYKLEKSTRR